MSPSDVPVTHRLGELLGATVTTGDGRQLGHVNDVRLAPGHAARGLQVQLLVDGLVISHRHAGSMLGYDRRVEQGPWLVRAVVRWVHRYALYLPWSAVEEVSWSDRRITVDADKIAAL
jgi:sporulation protein YlmC with PRC-barrel domain